MKKKILFFTGFLFKFGLVTWGLSGITKFCFFCSPGNLDPEVDEKLLYDTFSAFGVILTTPKIQRDPETGNSKGFAFINYASFEASDAAIEAMNGEDI